MGGIQNYNREWQFFNRVYIAQIAGINEANGTVDVVFLDNLAIKRQTLELPWSGLSMNGLKSSWIRYMPQIAARGTNASGGEIGNGGDLVYVAFGPKNEARIIGYATQEGMYEGFADERTNSPNKVPRGDFVDLKQGEWDMRSSGGAYVYGQRSGALLLSAGPTTKMLLDKQNNEMRGDTGLWKFGSTGSFLRVGDVKRQLLPTDFKETDVSSELSLAVAALDFDPVKQILIGGISPFVALDAAQKEWWLHYETPTTGAPGTGILIADEQFGAVRDAIGIPIPGLLGPAVPLRSKRTIWAPGQPSATPVPIPAHNEQVDALGNKTVFHGPTATQSIVTAPTVAVTETLLSLAVVTSALASISSAGPASLESATVASVSGAAAASLTSEVLANVDAPLVAIGNPVLAAANPAPHGTVVFTQLQTIVAALAALAAAMLIVDGTDPIKGPAWTALATAMTASQVVLAIPPGTPASLLSTKTFIE